MLGPKIAIRSGRLTQIYWVQNYTKLSPDNDPVLLEALSRNDYVSQVRPADDEYGLTVIAVDSSHAGDKVIERSIRDCFTKHHYDIGLIGSSEELGLLGSLAFCGAAVVAVIVLLAIVALVGLLIAAFFMMGWHYGDSGHV